MTIICNICHKEFTRTHDMYRHQQKFHAVVDSTDDKKHVCHNCGKIFSRKFTLQRHQQTICKPVSLSSPQREESYQQLVTKIKELENKLEKTSDQMTETNTLVTQIKDSPKNVLQVICITSNDNYIEMLTNKIGNYDQAIDYIKDCALSDLAGDCKLIEKLYDDDTDQSFYIDKKKANIVYYNEKKERVMENKDQFGRKIANNLQNSYLKGVNYLINKNLDKNSNPNVFLEDYDIMSWNRHIYNLSDLCYQRKMLNQLKIPNVPGSNVEN